MSLRGRFAAFLVALTAAAATGLVLLPPAAPATSATASAYSSDPVRVFYDAAGDATEVDRRHVELTVSATTQLRGRQEITVSWSGAHPTGGIATDPNSGDAAREEYPFVLLQCRGRGGAVTPQTCWTATAAERYVRSNPASFAWPAFRSDAFAEAADRDQLARAPQPRPADCAPVAAGAEHWVPFLAADGRTYAGGVLGCGGMAPEASSLGDVGMPSNTTYGVTGADGRGSTRFSVWSSDENASLGCSATVACSLVAVPVIGVSCDAWGTRLPAAAEHPTGAQATRADGYCRAADAYEPGELQQNGVVSNLATSGQLWWVASNWRNRIVVPLDFAVSSSVCGVVNDTEPLTVFGSILMNEITAQWAPRFCTDKALEPFVHVQAADTAARNLIDAGTAVAVLTTQAPPDGYARPVVQAPVALTGFAVAFSIDDAQGRRLTTLRLNARLLAKLLTQSYPATNAVRGAYAALAGNPLNITQDPEFQALNPDAPRLGAVEAASTVLALSTESDLMWALTSYLEADPEARDWLDGDPDPWGMVVNRNYRRIELPVASWSLLDGFELAHDTVCYDHSPSPYLSLVANPPGQLATLLQDLQYAISNVNTVCPDNAEPSDPTTLRLRVQGRQIPGHRFVLGIVPLTAAHRYGLETASLQTVSDAPRDTRFTDASGRSFVAPDEAGLKAGAALLEPDDDRGLWELPYDVLHTAAGQRAYPGTMPVYAAVPTSGLSSETARRVGQLLDYAAGAGQRPGIGTGQLPAGALPMTAADGLGVQAAYTHCAAVAVRAQAGAVPALGTTGCRDAAPSSTPTASPTTVSSPGASTSAGPTGPVVLAPVPAAPSAAAPSAGASPAPGGVVATAAVRTVGAHSEVGRFGLPAAAALAVLLAVFGALLRWGEDLGAVVVGAAGAVRRARRSDGRPGRRPGRRPGGRPGRRPGRRRRDG